MRNKTENWLPVVQDISHTCAFNLLIQDSILCLMTREEVKNHSEYISSLDMLDGIKDSYARDPKLKSYKYIVVCINGTDKREYHPIDFLELFLIGFYHKIDKSKNVSDKITIIYDAKVKVIHFLERTKQKIESLKVQAKNENFYIEDYDFSSILNQLEVMVEKVRLELEVLKYDLEVKKLRNETRWYKEPIFLLLAAFTAVGCLILVYNTFHQSHDTINTKTENSTKEYPKEATFKEVNK